ncbi:hypothetical protein AJ79_04869 [Helicocarpus griseus UAMH5409]|uniref:3'-5' exonuclease domain-containing protein n=1 Tax=Helicocarpus griseus UAMH5409 TaxID=1447875 RepID=A0A2B7XIE1_9EURO|nr:hypothetical protein AJ79_04869 [Helicocarpus griseus UAMH5409]
MNHATPGPGLKPLFGVKITRTSQIPAAAKRVKQAPATRNPKNFLAEVIAPPKPESQSAQFEMRFEDRIVSYYRLGRASEFDEGDLDDERSYVAELDDEEVNEESLHTLKAEIAAEEAAAAREVQKLKIPVFKDSKVEISAAAPDFDTSKFLAQLKPEESRDGQLDILTDIQFVQSQLFSSERYAIAATLSISASSCNLLSDRLRSISHHISLANKAIYSFYLSIHIPAKIRGTIYRQTQKAFLIVNSRWLRPITICLEDLARSDEVPKSRRLVYRKYHNIIYRDCDMISVAGHYFRREFKDRLLFTTSAVPETWDFQLAAFGIARKYLKVQRALMNISRDISDIAESFRVERLKRASKRKLSPFYTPPEKRFLRELEIYRAQSLSVHDYMTENFGPLVSYAYYLIYVTAPRSGILWKQWEAVHSLLLYQKRFVAISSLLREIIVIHKYGDHGGLLDFQYPTRRDLGNFKNTTLSLISQFSSECEGFFELNYCRLQLEETRMGKKKSDPSMALASAADMERLRFWAVELAKVDDEMCSYIPRPGETSIVRRRIRYEDDEHKYFDIMQMVMNGGIKNGKISKSARPRLPSRARIPINYTALGKPTSPPITRLKGTRIRFQMTRPKPAKRPRPAICSTSTRMGQPKNGSVSSGLNKTGPTEMHNNAVASLLDVLEPGPSEQTRGRSRRSGTRHSPEAEHRAMALKSKQLNLIRRMPQRSTHPAAQTSAHTEIISTPSAQTKSSLKNLFRHIWSSQFHTTAASHLSSPMRIPNDKSVTPASKYWSYDLNKTPDGGNITVHYCTSLQTTEQIAKHFLSETVVGLDLEWKAQASSRDSVVDNVSVIQLASKERIALFHLALFNSARTSQHLVSPTLKKVLESPDIIKVGVNIKGDCTRLRKYLEIQASSVFELSHLHKVVKHHLSPGCINRRPVCLADQVEEHLGLPLDKDPDIRLGGWSKRLTLPQVRYAATDPYAALHLFHVLEAKRLKLQPVPPRPDLFDSLPPVKASSKKQISLSSAALSNTTPSPT